jgi:putative nucleotidyltransferase with HDIG domain
VAITTSCPDSPYRTPSASIKTERVSAALDETTHAWLQALSLRDDETIQHTLRVTELTVHLSHKMRAGGPEPDNLRRGAILHDIGKLAVPDRILLKPGPLNESEWQIMRQHPSLAYHILKSLPYPAEVLEIPYCHHERWDGSGYPRGLKRAQIPLPARIFAVVDVWDALCSNRPYRAAWPPLRALQYIIQQAGRQFDPLVVNNFIALMKEAPHFFALETA